MYLDSLLNRRQEFSFLDGLMLLEVDEPASSSTTLPPDDNAFDTRYGSYKAARGRAAQHALTINAAKMQPLAQYETP